jgi:hypothetical protein
MMSALLLMMAVQTASPASDAAEEITVIGQRLREWRGRITPAGQAMRCVTLRSTGDAEVDEIGCGAMVQCFTPLRPRMIEAASRPRAERRPRMAAIEREVGACMVERRDQLIENLAERRYRAREGNQNAAN